MDVLIIGGTGNISTSLTRQLLARGDRVTHYNRGHHAASAPAECRLLIGDRTQHAAFEAQLAQAGSFDAVIDMIAYAPEDAASAVRAFGGRVGQYLFCSTVDVYTKPAARYPVAEDAPRAPNPAFAYAHDKLLCENTVLAAHARSDLPVTIVRPGATYNESGCPISLLGPGPTWLRRLREGRPVIVLGDGTSLWGACHRDDVAAGIVGAVGNPTALGQAYNLTADECFTWEEYYQTIARVMDAPPVDFVRIPARLVHRLAPRTASWCEYNFQHHAAYDNCAAKAALGFHYTVSWEAGARAMVAWQDARGEIDRAAPYPLYDQVVAEWRRAEASLANLEA